jgi:hypothetical protein
MKVNYLALWAPLLALSVAPTAADPPTCESDVVKVRQIGDTSYVGHSPINILSQNAVGVTFQLSQAWTQGDIASIFVRFKESDYAFPNCHSFQNVNATWTSDPFVAVCGKKNKSTIVEI